MASPKTALSARFNFDNSHLCHYATAHRHSTDALQYFVTAMMSETYELRPSCARSLHDYSHGYRPAVNRFFDQVPPTELEVGGLVSMAGDPLSNGLPEVPCHCKLNIRQNQRQRMRNSGCPFFSPDFILTRLPTRMR